MKKDSEFEMRAEYDFSGAVRGRHAARLSALEKEKLRNRAAVQDFQTWINFALVEVQAFEAALFRFMVLARNDSPEQAGQKAAALLDARERPRLQQLVSDLGAPEGEPEDEVLARLARLVMERNWLVHRSVFESQAALLGRQPTEPLLARLERLSDEAQALRAKLEAVLEKHLSGVGLSRQEIERKTAEATDLWLAQAA